MCVGGGDDSRYVGGECVGGGGDSRSVGGECGGGGDDSRSVGVGEESVCYFIFFLFFFLSVGGDRRDICFLL